MPPARRAIGFGPARPLRALARLTSCVAVAAASTFASDAVVRFQSGDVTLASQSPAVVATKLDAARETYVVLRLKADLDAAGRQALHRAGVKLLDSLGEGVRLARVEGDADLAAVRAHDAIVAVEPFRAEWKLAAAFANPAGLPVPVVTDYIPAYVLFQSDVDLFAVGEPALAARGGLIVDVIESLNGFVVELPRDQISKLAQDASVKYIEPALPALGENNAEIRSRVGADVAQSLPIDLDGSGVSLMIYDGGTVRATHTDFGGRVSIRDTAAARNHATHVAGTILGSGAASAGLHAGMAPGATLESYAFSTAGGTGVPLYTNPGDLEASYANALTFGVAIANNSVGSNISANGQPCSFLGDYGATPALVDAIVRGSLGRPLCVVFSNGNERSVGRCGTSFATMAPPATCKNALCVGSVQADTDTVSSFSSFGPTDDGRLKPDFVAPGCQTAGDGGVTSTSFFDDTSYTMMCGTSMSAPTVSGLSALLLQAYRDAFPGATDPRNSTYKAIFAHTAVDLGNVGPDYQTGYGSVRVLPAIDVIEQQRFLEDDIASGETRSYSIPVVAGGGSLRVTLAWDDPAAAPNVVNALINDLNLKLIDPSGAVTHWPWTLDPANPGAAAVRTGPDTRNVMEQVVVDSPVAGGWRIEVSSAPTAIGTQRFSLVASADFLLLGAIGDMNCDGFVTVADIGGFVNALIDPAAYALQYPGCEIRRGDVNEDGFVTVADIGAFVALLTQ